MRSHEADGLLAEFDERIRPLEADIDQAAELDSPAAKRHRVTIALWWLIGIVLLLAGLEPLVVPNTPPTAEWVTHVHQSVPAGPIKP